ncbi:MAG TPA: hypothetical protein VKU94_03490 [Geobacterales bacterium]|nr:hypothetical protein [Geobacterales bacterium]
MSIRDIIKHAKRGGKYDLRCPICGSKKVTRIHSLEWLIPQQYLCKECGYVGSYLISFEKEAKDEKEGRF